MLSIPTVLSELTSIVMQYINADTWWEVWVPTRRRPSGRPRRRGSSPGICTCVATGFTVQVAQLVGAGKLEDARNVLRQALSSCWRLACSSASSGCEFRCAAAMARGDPEIWADASGYFLVYSCGLPALQMVRLCTGMLQCSGNVKTPSIINVGMRPLDVMFNALFIFPSRTVSVLGPSVHVPGVGLGVPGAAAGTACRRAGSGGDHPICDLRPLPGIEPAPQGQPRAWTRPLPRATGGALIAGPTCSGARVATRGAQVAAPPSSWRRLARSPSLRGELPCRDCRGRVLHAGVRHLRRCDHVGGAVHRGGQA